MQHTNRFDLDLQFGKKYENALQKAVEGTNECKCDRIWHRTGNVYIETESRGKPSGINVTKAKYWSFCLHSKDRGEDDQIWLLIPTHLLKEFIKDYPIKNGGDNYRNFLSLTRERNNELVNSMDTETNTFPKELLR